MKPTLSDLRFWDALQAKRIPEWARKLEANRARSSLSAPPRDQRIASLLHDAINQHCGWPYGGATTRPKLDQRNAITLLQLVRKNQARGLYEPEGARTLFEYMRCCDCPQRAPYFRRWVRRMSK